MEEEYRSLENARPVVLDRNGLRQLEQVLRDALPGGRLDLTFEVSHDNRTMRAETVDALASKNLPVCTDRMTVTALRWDSNQNIVAGVYINFNHNNISWQPHAVEEGTFLALKKRVAGFLEDHQPWYWRIDQALPDVSGIGIILAMLGTAFAAWKSMYWIATILAIFGVGLGFAAALSIQQRLFPFVTLSFEERPAPNYKEIAVIILMVLTLLATVAGILVDLP